MVKKVGFFSFTCCEGCTIVFIEALNKKYFDWTKKMKLEHIRVLRKERPIQKLDLAFVEGAISTPSEIKKLKKIREKSSKVIALGSGAINGFPSNQRNNLAGKRKQNIQPLIQKLNQIEKILPIKEFIKVDDEIPGCPVDEKLLIKKIDTYLRDA
jgi:sulfhydrogenase subunit delta